MSKINTWDTVVFNWDDPRTGTPRELNTALRQDKIIITDIKGIDDWTISRNWSGDPATARQWEIDHAWEPIVFDIEGKIVDETKQTDKVLRAFAKTAGIVRMHVVGAEHLDREFYITAFHFTRYGNIRGFTISCIAASGHISEIQTKVYNLVISQKKFTFPFSNPIGTRFIFGYSELSSSVDIHSDSFIAIEPWLFIGVFAEPTSAFALTNDIGQTFRIAFNFMPQDTLIVDLTRSIFLLTRAGVRISILPHIDYEVSTIFGIRQGAQTIEVVGAILASGTIAFVEHLS